jgi:hypothetical protein
MQATTFRSLILITLFAAGHWLLAVSGAGRQPLQPARWPAGDAVYAVDGWTAGPLAVASVNGITLVSRSYRHAQGTVATLAIMASPEAKRIYRAGAEVAFLANGYTTQPAPSGLAPEPQGRPLSGPAPQALLLWRGDEVALLLYSYGERRGVLGNGVRAWSLSAFDSVLGRPNDYFRTNLLVPLAAPDAPEATQGMQLAQVLFARLAAWYSTD